MNYTQHTIWGGTTWIYGDELFAEDMDMDGKADAVSGAVKIGWFRQITLNNFTEYEIDNLSQWTHWIGPFYKAGCFPTVDILVATDSAFLWMV